ncbi:MAG: hypothetical protein E7055_12675 [Lentisphaerae bacterium]|nr:hypothetical protein [Lentisphaerota bacterium]
MKQTWISVSGNHFLRTTFSLSEPGQITLRITGEPHTYQKSYCQALRKDGHDGNWLMGGSFIKFRIWIDGRYVGCGPLRAAETGVCVRHTFDLGELPPGKHTLAVACRGERCGICVELPVKNTVWKTFRADDFYSPVCWKQPNVFGYFKGDIGPGEFFENLDGTRYPDRWQEPAFDDSAWTEPVSRELDRPVTESEYNYQEQYFAPRTIRQTGSGSWIVDFGEERIGSLSLRGPAAGGEVEVRLGEELFTPDQVRFQTRAGVCYQELWTFRDGRQELSHFGVRMFRYAELKGYSGELRTEDVGVRTLRAPYDGHTEFQSGNDNLKRIWDLCRSSVINTAADLFTDCFTRERIAYEADAMLNLHSYYVFNPDLRLVRRHLSHQLNHPTWPCEWSQLMAMLFYDYWQETGDTAFIAAHFDRLRDYSAYLNLIEDGLIRQFPLDMVIDWPPEYRKFYDCGSGEYLTVPNALACKVLSRLAELARAIGRNAEADGLFARSREMRAALNRKCFDPVRGLYKDRPDSGRCSLHSNMWALWCDLVPEDKVPAVIDHVVSCGMQCSLYSGFYYLETLFRYGQGAKAFELLANDDSRWLDMVRAGLTVTSEYWYEPEKRMSLAHPWGCYPAYLIVRYIFGVRPTEPGWRNFTVEPASGFEFHGSLKMIRNGFTVQAER